MGHACAASVCGRRVQSSSIAPQASSTSTTQAPTSAVATALVGAWVVLVLLACGAIELLWTRRPQTLAAHAWPMALAAASASGGVLALCWTAVKVGALSYGGGFV